jgi:hypothetical protein
MFQAVKTWPAPALGLLIVLIPPVALIVAPEGLRESVSAGRWGYAAYFALLAIWGSLGLLALVLLVSAVARAAF